jgi:predicted Ser/Thr protein kinase
VESAESRKTALDALLGRIALERGLLRPEQLREALAEQAREVGAGKARARPLGVILVARGFLTDEQLVALLEEQKSRLAAATTLHRQDEVFGKLLVEKGGVPADRVNECLRLQAEAAEAGQAPVPRLGELLVSRGYATPETVSHVLASQKKTIVACSSCGKRYNVTAFEPTRAYTCKACGGPLQPLPRFDDVRVDGSAWDLAAAGATASRPAPAPSKPGPRPLGKYTILRELGRGGMGVVYEALDTPLNRKVALKMMLGSAREDPEEARLEEERFLRESRLSANLPKHPHIVSVYEAGAIEGKRYLAMEFIDGKSLSKWRKGASVTTRQHVTLLRDVALAVEHAHRHGIIHRDLKPENILLDGQDQPHVTDFGLAKTVGQNVGLSLTASGMVMGTPAYMSPEQAQGSRTIDHRTDVYALGVMLYEALTGRKPFEGETAIEILMKAAKNAAPAPSTVIRAGGNVAVDKTIENICLKCLAKRPEDRYSTARALAEDLTRWLNGEQVRVSAPVTTRRRVAPPRKSSAWIYGVAAAAVLAVVFLVALPSSRPAAPPDGARLAAEKARREAEDQAREERERLRRALQAAQEEADRARREKEQMAAREKEATSEAERQRLAAERLQAEARERAAEEERRRREEDLRRTQARAPEAPPPLPALPPPPPPAVPEERRERPAPVVAAPPPGKPGEPAAADQKAAEKLVRDRFREDFRKPSSAFAKKLLQEGARPGLDPAEAFVLLREARDVAVRSGDPSTALAAIEEAARHFSVDPLRLKTDALSSVGKSVRAPEDAAVLAECYLAVLEEALREDEYESAKALCARAEAAARFSKDEALALQVQARARETADLQKEHQRVKAAEKVLADKPEDGSAHLAIGLFLCFAKGEWERGLASLARGSSEALRLVAQKEMASPESPSQQVEVADGWWDLAGQREHAPSRARFQARAAHWYQKVWPRLEGAARNKARERIRAALLTRSAGEAAAVAKSRMPLGWTPAPNDRKVVFGDDRLARTGRTSLCLAPQGGAQATLQSGRVECRAGQAVELSAWVLSEGVGGAPDRVRLRFWTAPNYYIFWPADLPADQPFWSCVRVAATAPPGTTAVDVLFEVGSKDGRVWLDDVSLRRAGDDRELLENGSFEKRP